MKISLNWLSEYVDIQMDGEEISEILSNLGFPIEGMEYFESDTVIDVEVTSNRGDCLSHIGIARELAAFLGKKLKLPEVELDECEKDISDFVEVSIVDGHLCGRYTARVITDVKVGPTPDWMKLRLEAVGIRSINNVVDATNYAMMEGGQPPHAFDYDKLNGGKIIVRKGVLGERLVSIDETKCELNEDRLVIADANEPVAIAGVMGGLATEISDSTTTVLLEEAHFDPVSIRTTGRALGISSEASFRFERQVDIEMIDWNSRRCAQLITQVAGGKVVKGVADAYPGKWEEKTVGMRLSRLGKLLGIEVEKDTVIKIFEGLGFQPQTKQDDLIVCSVPTWRHDIYREADLIEEIARSYGYDNIPVEKKINIEVAPVDKREKIASQLRRYLNSCGFYETVNVTFVDDITAEIFGVKDEPENLAVRDVSRKSANKLRGNLIGSLLGVLRANYNAGNVPCRIFELADTFKSSGAESDSELPEERTKIGLVCDGEFGRIKGPVEGLIKTINKNVSVEFKPAEFGWASAGAEITVNGQKTGFGGVVSKDIADKFDISEIDISAAEVDFDTLLEMVNQSITVKPLAKFPAITRDLSLIVDEGIRWSDIVECVKSSAAAELEDTGFSGLYRGKPIEAGRKSITVSLRFRDEQGTLTHETVDKFEQDILDSLKQKLSAQLRTV